MRHHTSDLLPQPAVSGLVALFALLSLSTLTITGDALLGSGEAHIPVAIALSLGIVLSYRFPIHVGRSIEIYLSSAPLYLMVAILAPPVAAVAAGVGFLGGELVVRKARRNYYSDVITAAGRLTLVALIASSVAHRFPPAGIWHVSGLVAAALTLWAVDMWSAPLVIAPMCRERPLRVLRNILRQSAALEAVQYLLAVPGALVVADQPWALALFVAPTAVVYRHFKRAKELHAGTYQLLERLADTVDQRDAYTGGHSQRVADLCKAILKAISLGGPEAELIVAAARVHDIGKIDIPDHVLQKPGPLTPVERAAMQEHPERGAALLLNNPGFSRMAEMVRYHHEAWDGSGYPHGLRETAIPFGARVIAVADGFDAMTSDRPYRRGMSPVQAATRLLEGRGSQWDPAVVDALLQALPSMGAVAPAPPSLPVTVESLPLAIAR
jgi:hypothetical protein